MANIDKVMEIAYKHFGDAEDKDKAVKALMELDRYHRELKEKEWFDARFCKDGTYGRYFNVISNMCTEIKEGLTSGGMEINDATVYSVKKIAVGVVGESVRLFEQPKLLGVTNINEGKTPRYSLFLLSDIRLLFRADYQKPYTRIPYWMEDGEFVFRAGCRTVATLQMSDFATDTQTVQLTDPIPIRWQESYEPVIFFPDLQEEAYKGTYKGYLKILLHGLMINMR